MKLCVIGAGAAGLCAAMHGRDFGFEVTVFEKTREVGGVWAYTDEVGKDKNGLDVHSSMYQGLKTNLPKEIMGYPDFSFPEQKNSYISWEYVLKFYQSYAEYFDLKKLINFEHHVERVRPLLDAKWEIIVQDVATSKYKNFIFDAVLICNGHYSAPNMPRFEGQEMFKGKQIHSHDYRKAEDFRDETVLVVGVGPSGTDCVIEVAKVAKHVGWSHHTSHPSAMSAGENVSQKPGIKKINENSVEFDDGSYYDYSVLIYCTGFNYAFPFLSVDCGISCIDNFINPLYKEVLNITYPSMGFIGIQKFVSPNQLFDLQVRFALTFMSGRKQLPTKAEMLEDSEKENADRLLVTGSGKNITHYLGPEFLQKYFTDLATTAEIAPIKPVIAKIFALSIHNLIHETETFRNVIFKVIDDGSFTADTLK